MDCGFFVLSLSQQQWHGVICCFSFSMNFPFAHTARTHFVVWLLNFSFLNVPTCSVYVFFILVCRLPKLIQSNSGYYIHYANDTEHGMYSHTANFYFRMVDVISRRRIFIMLVFVLFFTCFNCFYLILPRMLPMKCVAKCTIPRNAIHSHPFTFRDRE